MDQTEHQSLISFEDIGLPKENEITLINPQTLKASISTLLRQQGYPESAILCCGPALAAPLAVLNEETVDSPAGSYAVAVSPELALDGRLFAQLTRLGD